MIRDTPAPGEPPPNGVIAVIGAGATGTTLAALVGQVAPVVMVCRNPDRADRLARHGARVTGLLEGASRPAVVPTTADLARIGPIRTIFVTTKTTAIPAVADDLRALLPRLRAGAPFIISFQNGIDPGLELSRRLGSDRVLRMVLNFGATLPDPHADPRAAALATLAAPPSYIGSVVPRHFLECEALASLLSAAGLKTCFDEQIERRVWAKAVLNASMNPVAALVNSTVGEVLDSPSRQLVGRLLDEAIATAQAEHLDLGPDPAAAAWAALEHARPHTPSMVEDIRAGRESEVGQLNRQIVEHARRVGVPTPTHGAVAALIETFDWKVYSRCRRAPAAPPVEQGAGSPA